MRRQIHLLVLIVPLILPAFAYSQEEEQELPEALLGDDTGGLMDEFALLEEELSADEIVSASKHRQSIFWSPAAVTIFTKKDILASGAFSLADLLRRVPGFDIYSMKNAYTLVGARALTNQNNNLVLLLVDGREELVELTGFAFWEGLGFDLEEIERIEVVRGPGSALYGANAVAAVVSVTTLPDRPVGRAYVKLTQGENRRSYASARVKDSLELAGGVLSYSLGLGLIRHRSPSDPRYLDQNGYRTHNYVRYRLGKELDLSLHAGGIFGEAMMYMFAGDMTVENVATPWVQAKADIALGESSRLKTQLYYNHYQGDLGFRVPLRGFGIWIADFPDLLWRSDTLDGQVHFEHRFADQLLLIAGGNIRYSTLTGQGLILNDNDEVRGAGFIHLEWEPLEMLQVIGGVRLDLNDLTDPAVSPRGALVFRPWENQAFRLGYGLAFRKPSFFEMLMHLEITDYNPAFPEIVEIMREQVGNPNLDNMKLHSFEAGWQGRFLDDRLRLSLDLFYSIYRDTMAFLSYIPLRFGLPNLADPETFIGFDNGEYDSDAFGGEVEITWRPLPSWYFWCNLGIREVESLEYGRREKYEPRTRLNLGIRYLPHDAGMFADVAVHYVSTYKQYLPYPGALLAMAPMRDLGDCALMIARLGYRLWFGEVQHMEIGVTVRTPLGLPFREYDGRPMPAWLQKETSSDFGGEEVTRLLSAYLRGSF